MIKFFRICLIFLFFIIALTIVANLVVTQQTQDLTTADINRLPAMKCGLVLGTSKFIKHHRLNPYFIYRINAAVRLYRAKKVQCLILSGDNRHASYNEPREMRRELVKQGVPESALYLDFAGFRTLDSVVRAKEVFGQDSYIVISQQSHNERAVFIAHAFGIKAVGYNARDLSPQLGLKTQIREYFARVKMFIDLFLNRSPRFLGEKIVIDDGLDTSKQKI